MCFLALRFVALYSDTVERMRKSAVALILTSYNANEVTNLLLTSLINRLHVGCVTFILFLCISRAVEVSLYMPLF